MAKPKGFLTYLDSQQQLDMLSDEQAGRLYKALCNYAATAIKPDLSDDPVLNFAFVGFSAQIDRDNEKYDSTCRKRSVAGKAGGAPDGNKNAENKQNKQMLEKQAKQANVVNSSKTSKEKKKYKEKYKDKEKEKEKENRASSFADEFNRACPDLPKVKSVDGKREMMIDGAFELLEEYGVSTDVFFKRVHASDFLCGRGRDWKASFDWILQPGNIVKIIEGNYDNNHNKPPPKGGAMFSTQGGSFDIAALEDRGLFD